MGLWASPAFAQSTTNISWPSQSIYQIITDRFFNGDPSNDNAEGTYDPRGHGGSSVHGGDFKGIEQKLDYIKSLGATAIWISPIVLNVRGEFHGYAALDFTKVAPHWGSLADLQHFVQAAHARGLSVIDDIVVNHCGNLIDSADSGYPHFKASPGYTLRWHNPGKVYPPPFDLNAAHPTLTNLFHNNGFIENFSDTNQVILGELSGLDDLRTETPYVREQFKKIYTDWIAQVGFDGFRVDTVKHVEMDFWQIWCPAIHKSAIEHGRPDFFMFGEVLSRSDRLCASYIGTNGGGPFKLDSVLDYPLFFATRNVFAKAAVKTSELADRYAELATNYDDATQSRLVTFLDNHDQPRFLSANQARDNINRLEMALVFLYTARGIPCLYYGTEQGFDGGNDPFDREDMFAGQFKDGTPGTDSFNMTHPLFQWVARLNNFRRLYPALQSGTQTILFSDKNGPGLFAFARRLGNQELLAVFNTSLSNHVLTNCTTIYPEKTRLVDLLDPIQTPTVEAGSKISSIVVPPQTARLIIAQSQTQSLDPAVTNTFPVHDGDSVAPKLGVVVEFSQPMDTNSVQAAWSLTPSIPGTFSWKEHNQIVTFAPNGNGFPASTTIHLRIAPTAKNESGHSLYAAFELQFKTKTE